MRSEGYGTLCVCVSTAIIALQATRWLVSNTSGFRTTRSGKLKKGNFPEKTCVQEIWRENNGTKHIHAATCTNVYTTRWTYLLALH